MDDLAAIPAAATAQQTPDVVEVVASIEGLAAALGMQDVAGRAALLRRMLERLRADEVMVTRLVSED